MVWSSGGDAALIIAALGVGAVLSFVGSRLAKASGSKGWLEGGIIAILSCGLGFAFLMRPATVWVYMRLDGLGRFVTALVLGLCGVVSIYSVRYMRESDGAGRYYGLLLLMSAGVVGVVASRDTIGVYLYFELMSISSYSLVSFRKDQWAPAEAGLKYAIMNATGTGLALLGVCLAYLYTGSTSLGSVGWVLRGQGEYLSPAGIAFALTVAGLGVKSAMVPFHSWLPDAYSAAPAGVSAILSGVVTETGLIAMLRLVLGEFSEGSRVFGGILLIMAIVTMTVGNLGALGQRNIKRMLAYSSIAQVGYMMGGLGLGFGLGLPEGIRGGIFHLLTHSAMKSAAFLSAGLLIDLVGSTDMEKMRGAAREHPLEVGVLTMACLSLAGIPGFAGFMSKWWIYRAGLTSGSHLGIAVSVTAIANSIISLGYYLPLIFRLFAPGSGRVAEPEPEAFTTGVYPVAREIAWEVVPVIALGVAIMVLGTYPVPVLKALESAASATMSLVRGGI